MTLVNLGTVISWPGIVVANSGAPAVSSFDILDAAGEYVAWISCAREAMTISHVGWKTAAVVGGTCKAETRIETVSVTTGLPSGTLWGTANHAGTPNTNLVMTTNLSSNTWTLHALTNAAVISAGAVFAVLAKFNTATSFQIAVPTGVNVQQRAIPYVIYPPMAAKTSNVYTMGFALGSSATTFYSCQGILPMLNASAETFSNSASGRAGLRFKVPFKCRCVGFRYIETTTTPGDWDIAMYSDGGTELSSSNTSVDKDVMHTGSAGLSIESYFDNPVTLTPATWYRAVRIPTSATNINVPGMIMPSASYISATPFGADAHLTTFASSTWTDSATDRVPFIDLLIDQLGDDAGGAAAAGSFYASVSG